MAKKGKVKRQDEKCACGHTRQAHCSFVMDWQADCRECDCRQFKEADDERN